MSLLLGVFVARPLIGGTGSLGALFAVLLAVGVAWPLAREAATETGDPSGHTRADVDDGKRGFPEAGAAGPPPAVPARLKNRPKLNRGPVGRTWPGSVLVPLSVGVGAFVLGRVLGGGRSPVPFRFGYIAAVTLAAVAEEAFFRRFVYAVLRPGGAALAIGGSTALFAVAHVTVYGWWVLPLDLAAGLILSWQRWSTGTWTVPAATHVIANLLVII